MTNFQRRRVAGFTLIELLVVIALLSLLSAIGAGAYFRIRGSQQQKNTEETVTKLESAFQAMWKAELDSAQEAFKGKLPGYTSQVEALKVLCDNDADRARSVWTYIWLKRAFPQTFTQAAATITIGSTTLTAPKMFTSPAFTSTPAPTPAMTTADEAAVILYRILTQKGSRGQAFNDEGIGALSTVYPPNNTDGQKVFTDTFGNPITFVRLSSGSGELNSAPYTKNTGANNDPLDPAGRLTAGTWTTTNKNTCLTLASRTSFAGTNWLPTLVSRGSAKDWGTYAPSTSDLTAIPDGFTCGYKLRRQGNRGDQ